MVPALGEQPSRARPREKKSRPLRIANRRRIAWAGNMRLAAAAEFQLRSLAAIGAGDQQHKRPRELERGVAANAVCPISRREPLRRTTSVRLPEKVRV